MTSAVEQQHSRVSVRILRPISAVLVRHGFNPGVALRQARIEQRVYDDIAARIPADRALSFAAAASEHSGIAALGLEAGKLYHQSQFDLLEYLAASHTTLEGTIGCMIQYQGLIMDGAGFCLESRGDHTLIRLDMPFNDTRTESDHDAAVAETIFAEAFLVSVALVGARVVGRTQAKVSQSEAWFAYPPPASADACRDFFQGRVRYDAPAHGLLVPNAALDAPARRANASVQSLLEQQLDELARDIGSTTTVAARVSSMIAKELAGGDHSMPNIATRLQMSPSTLRRRLAEEGLTHRDLLQCVREKKAVLSLRIPSLTLEEVAYRVGYDDVTVFHRAFKRWTGLSPHAFRTRHAG